jgi:hypothetical protein
MNEKKKARVEQAEREAADRRQKAIVSLAHCLGRADVYMMHHDGLVREMLDAGSIEAYTNVKKLRFASYVCAWFAGLSGVIERFQQLVRSGTLPPSDELDALIMPDFLDLIKPFRNAVSHCSDHDDERVLDLLSTPETAPDRAEAISAAFKRYFKLHSTRPIYVSGNESPDSTSES